MMECSIDYDGDGEKLENATETFPHARKAHVCDECGDAINIGDEYQYVKGICGGDLHTYQTCMTCYEIRTALFCNSWRYGGMWDDIHDEEYKPSMSDLAEFSSEAQIKLIEKTILDWHFDEDD